MAELRQVSPFPKTLYFSKVIIIIIIIFYECCDGAVAESCRRGDQLGEDQAPVGLRFGEKLIAGSASEAIRNSMICGFFL